MIGFPGACEWCGGSQVWTHHAGEVYVACEADCLSPQLDAFGRNPPLIALCEKPEETPKMEQATEEGVVPLESGAANGSDVGESEPPSGWLSSMWEGGNHGAR